MLIDTFRPLQALPSRLKSVPAPLNTNGNRKPKLCYDAPTATFTIWNFKSARFNISKGLTFFEISPSLNLLKQHNNIERMC